MSLVRKYYRHHIVITLKKLKHGYRVVETRWNPGRMGDDWEWRYESPYIRSLSEASNLAARRVRDAEEEGYPGFNVRPPF